MDASSPDATLVILPNNLGDVIMATPVVEGLKHLRPAGPVSFMVEDGFEGGIAGSPHVDRIIPFPRKQIRGALAGPDWRRGMDLLRDVARSVNESGYSHIVNLCQHDYVTYLAAALQSREFRGRRFLREGNEAIADRWSQYLYAIPFARRCNSLHATDVYRRIAGVSAHRGGYTLRLSEQEIASARRFLDEKGIGGGARIAVVQPGAAYPAKRWPVEHFAVLGRMFVDAGWQVVASGAPSERDLAHGIADAMDGRCTVVAGETTFRESIAIVARAQVCVTGDTALMHAAAALDVRTCALFGPTNPVETGPYGSGHWVLAGRCRNRPCFCVECRNLLCMKSIPPSTVFACIERDAPPSAPSCDIYRTALRPDGDYRIEPLTPAAIEYFDAQASRMTRRFMGEDPGPSVPPDTDGSCARESREFLSVIDEMANHLRRFTETRDAAHIRAFEKSKDRLSVFTGVGAFWAALFNVRVNSVPMMDPIAAVAATAAVCRKMKEEVRSSSVAATAEDGECGLMSAECGLLPGEGE